MSLDRAIVLNTLAMTRPYKRLTILTPRCHYFTIYLSEPITSDHLEKPIFLVLTDIMCTHTFMVDFFNKPDMEFVSSKSIFVIVELPGLEMCADTLDRNNFPKYRNILRDLVVVLNVLGVSTVVGIGDGIGSDLLARFALQHPTRIEGLILINFCGNSYLVDGLIDKIIRRKMKRPNRKISFRFRITYAKNKILFDSLVRKFGNNVNLENVELFEMEYAKRNTFSLKGYQGKVLVVVGNTKQLVKSVAKVLPPKNTLIVIGSPADVMVQTADKVAKCIETFCQNISIFTRHSRYTLFGNVSNINVYDHTTFTNDLDNDSFPTVDVETENCGIVRVHIVGDIRCKNFRTVFLALHDIGCNHSWFKYLFSNDQIGHLQGNCLFLIVDIPGQGKNCKTLTEFPSLEILAEDLGAVLKAFDLDQVVCFGDGAGADVAVRVSFQYPALVSGLILINFKGNECQFKNRCIVDLKPWNHTNGKELKGFPIRYLTKHKFGKNRNKSMIQVKHFQETIKNDLNLRNVQLFVKAFLKRGWLELSAINSRTTIILSEYVTGRHLRYLREIPIGIEVVKLKNFGDCLSECPEEIISHLPQHYFHISEPQEWNIETKETSI